jgi:acyl carrier protein
MTGDDILARVQAIVADVAGPDRMPAGAGPDTPLGEDGYWLDSVDVLEVIVACEREFGAVFEAGSDLTAEALRSSRGLADVIRSRISR